MRLRKLVRMFLWALMPVAIISGCKMGEKDEGTGKIKLITLDPEHFHSALVQKTMYPEIDSVVYVYAPSSEGLGLTEQLKYIEQYNSREQDPTHWVEDVYTGSDFLEKMLSQKKGNVVVLAGNNKRKTEYIKKSVDDGLNVLADKPMAINAANFDTLLQAFDQAGKNGVILYDIMTERSVTATILQKKLMHNTAVFGELKKGTSDSPSIVMESVHRYFKQVSGNPLIRPDWFFDPQQEGEAITDVGTHLVDLVQWICFPEEALDYKSDISIQSANIWPTPLTLSQFSKITRKKQFPAFLNQYVTNDTVLQTHGNGTINYTIRGFSAKVTTKWTYDAPEGAGDTHYALLKGTKADLEIRQGAEESWKPVLYIWPRTDSKDKDQYHQDLQAAVDEINKAYPGVTLEEAEDRSMGKGWKINIPEKHLSGHEAHFADVMKRYLGYLKAGKVPEWEIQGMITKYYITTEALRIAEK